MVTYIDIYLLMSDAKVVSLSGMGKRSSGIPFGVIFFLFRRVNSPKTFSIHRHSLVLHPATETNDRRNSRLRNKQKQE